MPYDKLQNNAASRPQIPQLGNAKKPTKPPITPRIAASATPSRSPVLRRGAQSETATSSQQVSKDDFSTPVRSYLNANITPRSSARQARAESTHSTPSASAYSTPCVPKPPNVAAEGYRGGYDGNNRSPGLGIAGVEDNAHVRPRSMLGESKHINVSSGSSSVESGLSRRSRENSPMFFHANEAKNLTSSREQVPKPRPQSKTSGFFYANGLSEAAPPVSAPNTVTTTPQERSQPRFFHANGTPEAETLPASTRELSSTTSPRIVLFENEKELSRPQSPLSPASGPQITSPRLAGTLPPLSSTSPRSSISSAAGILPSNTATILSIIGQSANADRSANKFRHGKSASVGSLDTNASGRRTFAAESLQSASPPSGGLDPTPLPNLAAATEAIVEQEESSFGTSEAAEQLKLATSVPPSPNPSQTVPMNLQQANELAANARRERKVLDLEITNSSLLAINRTLEREMRKQSAELRRFRRLSRSGRLSIANSIASSSRLSTLAENQDETGDEDHFSEDSAGGENESDTDISESDDSGSERSMSPGAAAESDARHREQDEKRLRLDLAKHQELLVDSQKMNQSLKRCLGLTEELIAEGRKALDYQIHVSDVQLGGRVLTHDDHHHHDEEDRLNSAEHRYQAFEDCLSSTWKDIDQRLSLESDGADRDSGVELEQPA
ncbi:hypothetical protein L228DRAFT_245100 [Xylona heveae TC161]|uniref:Uncharacterized protein n=1 Tax=Xylona heveae (strain CBS 132557 / TC161) TaxID=1328760 RepID=A0A165I0X6_XYLHT|nr:hypothetical protein L228DRAFT_245100 [Xylona heveae TC161]KZF24201.1 hypothetical protein L228DRAFT_245100 [Xylona heveae TC161]